LRDKLKELGNNGGSSSKKDKTPSRNKSTKKKDHPTRYGGVGRKDSMRSNPLPPPPKRGESEITIINGVNVKGGTSIDLLAVPFFVAQLYKRNPMTRLPHKVSRTLVKKHIFVGIQTRKCKPMPNPIKRYAYIQNPCQHHAAAAAGVHPRHLHRL